MKITGFGKDFLIYGLSASIGNFTAFFLVPVYTRVFSREEYGVIDLIAIITSICSILAALQLESAVSRYYYAEKDLEKRKGMVSTALWSIFGLSLFIYLLLFFSSYQVSFALFDTGEYRNLLLLAGVTIPLSSSVGLLTVVIRFKKKPYHFLFLQLVQSSSSLSVSIILVVYYKIGVVGVFLGQITGVALSLILLIIYLRKELLAVWRVSELRKMFRYSLPLVPAVIGSWANVYISRFVMLLYLTIGDIGLYAVALQIASGFKLIESALRMAWAPFLWTTYENNSEHRKIFVKVQKQFSLIVLFLVLSVTLFSKEIMYIVSDKSYSEAAVLIGPLAFSIVIGGVIMQLTALGPAIAKRTEYNMIIYLISFAVNVVCLFLLVPTLKLMGVALSLLIANLVFLIIGWYNSERLYFIGFDKSSMIIAISVTLLVMALSVLLNISLVFKFFLFIMILVLFIYKRKNLLEGLK
jgi:O-antigen/teichoic acid export membrane protein